MSVAGRDTELRPLRNIRASRNCLPPPREIEIATAVRELRANYYYGQTGELFRPFVRELRAKSARFIAGRSHFEQIPGAAAGRGVMRRCRRGSLAEEVTKTRSIHSLHENAR